MVTYDSEADAIYVYLTEAALDARASGAVARTDRLNEELAVDYDAAGAALGV